MEAHLALVPDDENPEWGVVKPVAVKDGSVYYGLSVGYFTLSGPDGNILITLYKDVDVIIHEVATSKAINAEIRATEKALNGVVIKPTIILNPVTKRFEEVYPVREG